jgi:HEPN domain-containing protein
MNKSYKEWLGRARSSLELAKAADNRLVYYEDLCFQAQQSAEKGLKGLLIFYGIEPEKTHNLYTLLQELEKQTEINDKIKQIIKRLSQNFSFGKATLKFAVLQGFKPEKPQSLSQNRAR